MYSTIDFQYIKRRLKFDWAYVYGYVQTQITPNNLAYIKALISYNNDNNTYRDWTQFQNRDYYNNV